MTQVQRWTRTLVIYSDLGMGSSMPECGEAMSRWCLEERHLPHACGHAHGSAHGCRCCGKHHPWHKGNVNLTTTIKRNMIRAKALSTIISIVLMELVYCRRWIKHALKGSSTFMPTHAPSGPAPVCPNMPIMDQHFGAHSSPTSYSQTNKIHIKNKIRHSQP
jgi:hypothetical protein